MPPHGSRPSDRGYLPRLPHMTRPHVPRAGGQASAQDARSVLLAARPRHAAPSRSHSHSSYSRHRSRLYSRPHIVDTSRAPSPGPRRRTIASRRPAPSPYLAEGQEGVSFFAIHQIDGLFSCLLWPHIPSRPIGVTVRLPIDAVLDRHAADLTGAILTVVSSHGPGTKQDQKGVQKILHRHLFVLSTRERNGLLVPFQCVFS